MQIRSAPVTSRNPAVLGWGAPLGESWGEAASRSFSAEGGWPRGVRGSPVHTVRCHELWLPHEMLFKVSAAGRLQLGFCWLVQQEGFAAGISEALAVQKSAGLS